MDTPLLDPQRVVVGDTEYVLGRVRPDALSLFALGEIEESAHFDPWSRDSIAELFRYDCYVVTAIASGAELLGFAALSAAPGTCDLMTIGLRREHQGRGLGLALLGFSLDLMAARGAEECLLEVRPSNAPARRLYERLGFVRVGLRKRYYKPVRGHPAEDALIMRVTLPRSAG